MVRNCNCFFFFQAEDGIRDLTVTGVQTCALPIWTAASSASCSWMSGTAPWPTTWTRPGRWCGGTSNCPRGCARSEERRVGKECRSRWSPDHEKKKERKQHVREGLNKSSLRVGPKK